MAPTDYSEITQALGLDDDEIALRKRYLELDEETLSLLAELHPVLEPERHRFAEGFYSHLLAFAPLRGLIGDEAGLQRLRETQAQYFSSLTAGEYGPAYVHHRLRVGIAHHRIGLEPKWYIGAYRKYLTELVRLLAERYAEQPARYASAVDAVLKVVLFDMSLALDTYFHHEHSQVVSGHQAAQRFRAALDTAPDGVLLIDRASMRIVDVNVTACELLGYAKEELLGRHPTDINPALKPGSLEIIYDWLLAAPERIDSHRARWRRKDGSSLPVEIRRRAVAIGDAPLVIVAMRDISAQLRAEEQLHESELLYRTTFEDAPVGVAHLDQEGRWLRVNQKLCDITGYAPDELLSKSCLGITHPDELDGELKGMNRLLAGRIEIFDREKRYQRKNGEFIWVHQRSSLFRAAEGKPAHFIAVTTDISERKAAEEELLHLNEVLEQRVRERTAELEATNRELEAFSYSLSHDLRAPLRSIAGFTRLVETDCGDRLDPNCREHLGRVKRATTRMDGLIEDMLSLSRIGSTPFRRQKVDLSAMALEIVEQLRQAQPGRTATCHIAPGIEAEGDSGLLRAALENLLGNAWKYTSRQAHAEIRFEATPDERGQCVYSVRDNGAGFDMRYAAKLFLPFQRLHHPDDFPGTGIGLATVQRIVRRHGGRIWAEAAPGRGASFNFTLAESREKSF
jgi:PAS domain S-box-containing protein